MGELRKLWEEYERLYGIKLTARGRRLVRGLNRKWKGENRVKSLNHLERPSVKIEGLLDRSTNTDIWIVGWGK